MGCVIVEIKDGTRADKQDMLSNLAKYSKSNPINIS